MAKLNELFEDDCFHILLDELEKYSKDVVYHYKEYIRTNEIWNELKYKIKKEVK